MDSRPRAVAGEFALAMSKAAGGGSMSCLSFGVGSTIFQYWPIQIELEVQLVGGQFRKLVRLTP
ncbi:MAG: hypothetical protein JWN70_1959 [Planctomycetaceae bacterium]|nr:hypothetical protein [Planctomycetaceae bacterium]